MAISVAQARQICSKAELELVLKSTTRQIGTLDAKQLQSAIRRTRTLRDKWRDPANSQKRDSKAKDAGKRAGANEHSAEKAQLFDEALTRFEKRLSRLEGSSNGAAKPSAGKTRTGAQQAQRPEVRSALKEKPAKANAAAAKRKSPAKAANESRPSTTPSAGPDGQAAKPADRKAVAKRAATKKSAPKRRAAPKASKRQASRPVDSPGHGLAAAAMAAGREGTEGGDKPSGAEKKRNLKAKTAAKATAISRSGSPRIQGHVSSQGRRNQAKRGSR